MAAPLAVTKDMDSTSLPSGERTKFTEDVMLSAEADTVATPATDDPPERTGRVATPDSFVSAESPPNTTPVPEVTEKAIRAPLIGAPEALR